jgi:hypothetical protein
VIDTLDAKKRQLRRSHALCRAHIGGIARTTPERQRAGHAKRPTKISMTPEQLFAALSKKRMPAFASSVLGFTIGSIMDCGVTGEEARELCNFLINKIEEVKKNPEAIDAIDKFQTLVGSSMGGR